jgi:hypothetical protein
MRKQRPETPIDRALALIAPNKDREQKCREVLDFYIKVIAKDPPLSPKNVRTQLAVVANMLRKALTAINQLPSTMQGNLLPPVHHHSADVSVQDLLQTSKNAELRLMIFLIELKYAATIAEIWSARMNVPRSGGRQDYRKQAAATYAHLLLKQFGRRPPTLTVGGDYFELASVLYEAVTGKDNVILSSQCLTAHREWRRL